MFNNSLGKDGFTWFIGVVENRTDPLKMGRVQVRCFGYHSDDKDLIPTNQLPWAVVVNSIDSASISGIGKSPTGIVEGSWVMGFFLDGEEAQNPMILGTIPSMSASLPDTTKGFNDPNGVYPQKANESDVNQLARGINKAVTPIDDLIEEPASSFNSSYPHNQVLETESGHIKEYDDTEGAERIREYHKSGTYYEVHPDGSKSTHVVSNNYKVVVGDESVHISGDVKVYIDGDATLNIQGDYNTFVGGKTNIVSAGNMRLIAPRIDLNPDEDPQDLEATKREVGGVTLALASVDGVQGTIGTPLCTRPEDQFDWAKKIYNEIFEKIDWRTSPKQLLDAWATAANNYYKQEKQNTVASYYEEDGTDPLNQSDYLSRWLINRARRYKLDEPVITKKDMKVMRMQFDEKLKDGTRNLKNTYYYFYPQEHSALVKRLYFLEMIVKATENANCEEVYNVLKSLVFKGSNPQIYLNSEIRDITVEDISDEATHTDFLGSPQTRLGGMWIPNLDKTQMAFTANDPLQTLAHEVLGHRNHGGKWGKDNLFGLKKVLLSKEEVKSIIDGFSATNIYDNKAKIEANKFLKKFQNIKFYKEEHVEDESLARIFAHLVAHRCTDFTKDCYAPLNSIGIKFSKSTVEEIDTEMRSLGLTVNRNKHADYNKKVSYYEGTQTRLITAALNVTQPIGYADNY